MTLYLEIVLIMVGLSVLPQISALKDQLNRIFFYDIHLQEIIYSKTSLYYIACFLAIDFILIILIYFHDFNKIVL